MRCAPVTTPELDIQNQPAVQDASSEPLGSRAFWIGLVASLLGAGAAFGLNFSATQLGAIMSVAGFAITGAMWYFGRKDVVPVDKANAAIQVAADTTPGTTVTGFSRGTTKPPVVTK